MNTGPFGYSDTSATVTVWLVVKKTPYTKYHRIELQSLGVTLFGRLNTVTVSGRACNTEIGFWIFWQSEKFSSDGQISGSIQQIIAHFV